MKTESFKLSKNTIALLEKNGITIATPIQKKIIPAVLAGKDVLDNPGKPATIVSG